MPKRKLETLHHCRCCNWLSPRKVMCQTCFDGCVMRPRPQGGTSLAAIRSLQEGNK